MRNRRTGALFALIAMIAVLGRVCTLRGWAQRTERYGSLTPAQVVERTRRICRVVWPQDGDAELFVDLDRRPNGRGPRVVEVTVRRADGSAAGSVMWSADSGELLRVMADRDWRAKGAARSRPELRALAARWLRDLEIGEGDGPWRLTEVTDYPDSRTACFVWRSAGRRVALHLDTESGNLMVLIAGSASPSR